MALLPGLGAYADDDDSDNGSVPGDVPGGVPAHDGSNGPRHNPDADHSDTHDNNDDDGNHRHHRRPHSPTAPDPDRAPDLPASAAAAASSSSTIDSPPQSDPLRASKRPRHLPTSELHPSGASPPVTHTKHPPPLPSSAPPPQAPSTLPPPPPLPLQPSAAASSRKRPPLRREPLGYTPTDSAAAATADRSGDRVGTDYAAAAAAAAAANDDDDDDSDRALLRPWTWVPAARGRVFVPPEPGDDAAPVDPELQ
ncbi:hypothetical protein HK405_015657, partial [Cladochytrium tenue]